ncbi:MAG: molecular chaperone TorD family protein [Nitrospirales bacterium]|nr:molecular chaperone TorD family protein [Nitrospirales bacterium]
MKERIPEELYESFAVALEYPLPSLAPEMGRAASSLALRHPEASELLRAFGAYLEQAPEGEAEEMYTTAFDLSPFCPPYVGYHLFGDEYRRGIFMACLKESYYSRGNPEGSELPDHIGTMLRFLARGGGDVLSAELAEECIVPALEKMAEAFGGSPNPYGKVILSLLLVLKECYPSSAASRGGEGAGSTGGGGRERV